MAFKAFVLSKKFFTEGNMFRPHRNDSNYEELHNFLPFDYTSDEERMLREYCNEFQNLQNMPPLDPDQMADLRRFNELTDTAVQRIVWKNGLHDLAKEIWL